VLQADAAAGTVRSAGAGNVMAGWFRASSDRTLLCQHGTAGVTIRTPEEITTPWPPHALLVVCSDGIEPAGQRSSWPGAGRDPALAAALLVRDHCRARRRHRRRAAAQGLTCTGSDPAQRRCRPPWSQPARGARLRAELEETNRGVLALYAELDAQADQLRQATELKSRFLAYMSHEFRTPINSIRSITRLLLDRWMARSPRSRIRQVTFIQQNATEFAEMVDDLLDLAKVEAGRVEISPAWFEMVDLFSALRGMFKPVLTNPDVNLVFEDPQTCPSCTPTTASCRRSCATSFPTRSSSRPRARCGCRPSSRATSASPSRSPIPASASRPSSTTSSSRTSPGEVAAAAAPARHRPRPVAQQEAGRAAGRQRRLESETGKGSVFSVTIPVQLEGARPA
jgi:hypothetical protein